MQIGSFERHFKFWNWIQLRVGTIQVFLPNQESKQSENLNYINNFYYFRLLTVPIFMYPRKKLKYGLILKKDKEESMIAQKHLDTFDISLYRFTI